MSDWLICCSHYMDFYKSWLLFTLVIQVFETNVLQLSFHTSCSSASSTTRRPPATGRPPPSQSRTSRLCCLTFKSVTMAWQLSPTPLTTTTFYCILMWDAACWPKMVSRRLISIVTSFQICCCLQRTPRPFDNSDTYQSMIWQWLSNFQLVSTWPPRQFIKHIHTLALICIRHIMLRRSSIYILSIHSRRALGEAATIFECLI